MGTVRDRVGLESGRTPVWRFTGKYGCGGDWLHIAGEELQLAAGAETAWTASMLMARICRPRPSCRARMVVRGAEEFRRIARYTEMNPVSAGITMSSSDYLWSSIGRTASPPQDAILPCKTMDYQGC